MSRSIRWYWVGLLSLLLITRLSALNATLLIPSEARAALDALAAANDGQWPLSSDSPLLLVGNALLFLLFGGGSGLARFLPAVAGILLALAPWLWRDVLPQPDRRNASLYSVSLVAAALLALSPMALHASRQAHGMVLGILGGGLVVTALFITTTMGGESCSPWLLGAGLAVGLTGGAAFYDVLIPGVLAWGIWSLVEGRPLFRQGTLLRAAGLGYLVALLISVGLGWRWNGLAGPVEGLVAWLREWTSADARFANPLLLFLYEPLLVLLAGCGIVLAARRRNTQILVLAGWAGLAIVLVALRPGASPGALVASLFPLCLVAGWTLQHFTLPRHPRDEDWLPWVHVALGFVLWVFIGLVLLRQAGAPYYANGLELPLVALVLVIQLLLVVGLATLAGWQRALTGVVLSLMAIFALFQISFGMGAVFLRSGNPAEPLVTTGVSEDLRNLRRTIEDLRVSGGLSPDALGLVAIDNDPSLADTWAVVRWALQPLAVGHVAAWPAEEVALLLTSEAIVPPEQLMGVYSGTAFNSTLQSGGTIPGCEAGTFPPVCTHPLAWYFYRRTPVAPRFTRVVLWTRVTGAP